MTNFFSNRDASADPLLERLRASTVGLYDVAGEIGRGGMAIVYIATDLRLRRRVAIKVMEPRLNFTPGMAERFLQEARIAAQLQHHNIIVVHEVRQDEELIFFVMRLVEGGSLDEICRRLAQQQQQLPIDQAQWILWQSARALAYAHSEGFVHRDVKPANILVSTKGEVVVMDFGIAKAVDAEGLTKTGMAIGTPKYMSPEQFIGQAPLSGAADQYALGVAAYEMLTGAPPFSGDLYRIIAAHGSTPAPDIREKRPDCPEPLAEAIMRMLAKKPGDRWPSLDAALAVLGQGLAIDGSSTRANLATFATELQQSRASSVAAWSALTPVTPSWSSKGTQRASAVRPVPTAISVSPPNAQIAAGKQLPLRAVVTSDVGTTISDAVVTWTSTDSTVATVTSEGEVTAVASGSVFIRAEVLVREGSTGVVRAVAELLVTEREVTRIEIRNGNRVIEMGEACRLTAELFDDAGLAVETANIQWASSRPQVVHIDAHGTVLGLGTGQSVVSARVAGVQSSVQIDVKESLEETVSVARSVQPDLRLSAPAIVAAADAAAVRSDTPSSPQVVRSRLEIPKTSGDPPARDTRWKLYVTGAMVILLNASIFSWVNSRREPSNISGAPANAVGSVPNGSPVPHIEGVSVVPDTSGAAATASGASQSDSSGKAGAGAGNSSASNGVDVSSKVPTASRQSERVRATDAAARTSGARTPRVASKPETAIVSETSLPPRATESAGPSTGDGRRLAQEYALRLDRGEFRTGTLASFFSGTTSSHRASLIGDPRIAGRDGDALLVDVDLQVERTLGSGAVQRRVSTVRLVLRSRAGVAVIESATAGAVTSGR